MNRQLAVLSFRQKLVDFSLNTLWRGRLARASGGLVLAGISGGVLGYGFQIAMGRLLSSADYGRLNALMSLLMILAVPLGTVAMVITRRFAAYWASGDQLSLTALYWHIHRQVALFGVAGGLVLLVITPFIQSYIHTSSPEPVLWFIAVLFFSLFPIISHSLLQGIQNFRWLALVGLQLNLSKFLLPLLLVGYFGLGLNGSLAGLAATSALSWGVAFLLVRRYLVNNARIAAPLTTWRSSLPVLLANICFAAMTQLDMTLVNYYFPGELSGNYAAAAVLGKSVLYLPGGIVAALFPMVAENQARGQSSTHLFITAVILTGLLSAVIAIFFYTLSDPLLALFFGNKYEYAPEVLRYFGFAMLPMALVLVAEYFLIAKGRVFFAYLFMIAAPCQIAAIHFYHSNLIQVVAIVTGFGGSLAVVGYTMLWREYQRG